MSHPSEHMVTNLGDIPEGVSVADAVRASAPLRKYRINPQHQSRRLTICETAREIWRLAGMLPEAERDQFRDLAAAAFNHGKCMDARMRQLRDKVLALGGDLS